jgi:hypothetical protein
MTFNNQTTLKLLPPAPNKCPLCATEHNANSAHNKTSLFYAVRFLQQHGREATWSDAIAHLGPLTKMLWQQELTKRGIWTDHPSPIAEPMPKPNTLTPTARKESGQHAANSPPPA